MHQVELIDPADLRVHSEAGKIPEWSKDCPEFLALVDSIQAEGITEPLVCVRPNLVLLGRARWRAARQLQIAEVPVRWCEASETATLVLSSLLHRRHLSKGARAYLSLPFLDSALMEASRKREQNLKKGQQIPDTALSAASGHTQVDVAKRHGICERLLRQAKEVHKEFESKQKYPWDTGAKTMEMMTLREWFEPQILASLDERPLGLGAVIAGIASKKSHASGKTQRETKQLTLFTEGVGTLINRFTYWQGFDKSTKEEAMGEVRKEIEMLSWEEARELAAFFSDMARDIRRQARKKTKSKEEAA